jgi:hypothetical protein
MLSTADEGVRETVATTLALPQWACDSHQVRIDRKNGRS